jgi:cobyrinic acid a,c-diamide synthase
MKMSENHENHEIIVTAEVEIMDHEIHERATARTVERAGAFLARELGLSDEVARRIVEHVLFTYQHYYVQEAVEHARNLVTEACNE